VKLIEDAAESLAKTIKSHRLEWLYADQKFASYFYEHCHLASVICDRRNDKFGRSQYRIAFANEDGSESLTFLVQTYGDDNPLFEGSHVRGLTPNLNGLSGSEQTEALRPLRRWVRNNQEKLDDLAEYYFEQKKKQLEESILKSNVIGVERHATDLNMVEVVLDTGVRLPYRVQ
jgi:hypothetical protein